MTKYIQIKYENKEELLKLLSKLNTILIIGGELNDKFYMSNKNLELEENFIKEENQK